MRICLVTSSYPRYEQDGNARFVRSIAEAQAALGHEVHVLAPYTPQVCPVVSPVQLHWFRYVLPTRWGVMGHAAALENDRNLRHAVLWQSPLYGLFLTLALQRVVSRWKIDLIHAHWVIPTGFLASWVALSNRKPLFISIHGSDMYMAQRSALFGTMASWAFRHAQGVTACSQPLADSAVALGASPQSVRVIPYGADPSRFNSEVISPGVRSRLGFSPDELVILAVGRLVGKKGFDRLVRAMPQVLAAVPQARLVIAGDGPERTLLEQLVVDLGLSGKVLLPGIVAWTEMPSYLAASEVFVMPSVRDVTGNVDGLPNVILEAMAAGRPVVATRIAGIPLVVQGNHTGILVEEAAPEQLSRALIRLLKSREERIVMGQAGRMRVERELNWMESAKRVDQMYREAL
jgi:glycosyltransferase involved in cell wall biosynthesis